MNAFLEALRQRPFLGEAVEAGCGPPLKEGCWCAGWVALAEEEEEEEKSGAGAKRAKAGEMVSWLPCCCWSR